jgi:hypothetical protein
MNSANCVLLVAIIILVYFSYAKKESFDSSVPLDTIKSAGYASAPYMDHYKYMVIQENQLPMTLFEAVNTFHTGDVLLVQCNKDGNDCPIFKNPYGTNNIVGDGQCRKDPTSVNYIWVPVAKVISVMEVDAFAVVVLDRAVNISGRKLGVQPTKESVENWSTTIFPDPNKTPVTEIMSMSRWQVY